MPETDDLPESLLSDLANDPSMIELIELYVDEMPDKVAAIEQTLADGNYQDLARIAHQIKGSAGGYGFAPITQHAALVERSALNQTDLPELDRQVRNLIKLCLRAKAKP